MTVTLTPRQVEIARLLLVGESNKVIARKLSISLQTAKIHVSAILQRVGAKNRTEAAFVISRDGLVN